MSVDCDKEDCEEGIYSDVQAAPESSEDPRCLPYSEYRPVQDFYPISCFSGQLRLGPVVVRYRPERVMRQFGYIQCIPAHPVHPWVSYDDNKCIFS